MNASPNVPTFTPVRPRERMLTRKARIQKEALLRSLPTDEARAVELWIDACFKPYQQEWLFDWSPLAVWVKGRQVGGSHTTAGKILLWAMLGETTTIVSLGQKEATRVLKTVSKHAKYLHEIVGSKWAKTTGLSSEELHIASGGIVISAPSTSAGRGLSGNVFLDEFAYPRGENDRQVWDAAIGAITHGFRLHVVSTPNGQTNQFYELVHVHEYAHWSRHFTTIHQAITGGMSHLDPAKLLREQCAGNARFFARVYECSFLDQETALFEGANYYTELPKEFRVAHGFDGATTTKTASDYNAIVSLAECLETHKIYVLSAHHEKAEISRLAPKLSALRDEYAGSQIFWHTGGGEDGTAQVFRNLLGFPLVNIRASSVGKKFQRALPVATQWNMSNVLLPRRTATNGLHDLPPEFLREVHSFTGDESGHDDFVDALASAYYGLPMGQRIKWESKLKTHFATDVSVSPFADPAADRGFVRW